MLTTLALILVAAAPPEVLSPDEAGVRAAFARYRDALLQKDGGAAAGAVDEETVAFYAGIREAALGAAPAVVKKRGLLERMMFLRLRHELDPVALQRMSGGDLLAYGVDKGWVSASSVASAALGQVKVSGVEATGQVLSGGRPTPFSFSFRKSGDGWRFRLMPLMMLGEPALKEMAERQGLEENEFLFRLLEQVSGQPVPKSVWEPLVAPVPAPRPLGGAGGTSPTPAK